MFHIDSAGRLCRDVHASRPWLGTPLQHSSQGSGRTAFFPFLFCRALCTVPPGKTACCLLKAAALFLAFLRKTACVLVLDWPIDVGTGTSISTRNDYPYDNESGCLGMVVEVLVVQREDAYDGTLAHSAVPTGDSLSSYFVPCLSLPHKLAGIRLAYIALFQEARADRNTMSLVGAKLKTLSRKAKTWARTAGAS